MGVGEEDVLHVAGLARLGLAPGQLPRLVAELNGILAHMQVLAEVNTEGVEPAAGVGTAGAPLRVDHGPPLPLLREREALAPRMEGGFYLVPRLASHADAAAPEEEEGA